jgi:hypothetical protein
MKVDGEWVLSNDDQQGDDDKAFGFRVMRCHYVERVPEGL